MNLTDIFTASAVALNRTETVSNAIPFIGEAFFPSVKKMGIDLKWIKSHKGLGIALKPSNFDAIPTLRPRGEFKTTKEEMPFFRESMLVKEHDMMEIMRVQDANDPYADTVLADIFDDTNALIDGAEISVERMRMQLLSANGGNMGITIGTADNTVYNYDYDTNGAWKASHYLQLTGGDTWDNHTTATPLDDLRTAILYLASIGVRAKYVLGNSVTFDYLLENDQMKNALISITGQSINFMDVGTAEEILRRKLKVEFLAYDKMFQDYDGAQKKFYPDNYITIIGEGTLGNTYYGTTPEERTLIGNSKANVSILDPGMAIAVKTEPGPPVSVTTTVSQVVLPSFEGMDKIYVIKVK